MFGEYNFWVMEYAWQVSTIKKTSLYLTRIVNTDCYMQEDVPAKTKLIACGKSVFPLIWSKTLIQMLPSFLPHLFKGICQLNTCYLLSILKLEKAITTMSWKQNNTYSISNCRLQSRQQGLHWRQHRSERNANHLVGPVPVGIPFN